VASKKSVGRDETKQQTRTALIDAGIALFAEEGLDGPSLDAICDRAGFTRGAFYVHFHDRDEFLQAVMESVGARFLDDMLRGDEEDSGLAKTAARFIRAVAAGDYPLMREGGVRPHQLLDACARSPAVREKYIALAEESVQRLARIVKADQKAGRARDDADARGVATILLAAIIGVQTMNELQMKLDLPRTAATMLRLLEPRKS
jgi:AcrR family transcriptional regulator